MIYEFSFVIFEIPIVRVLSVGDRDRLNNSSVAEGGLQPAFKKNGLVIFENYFVRALKRDETNLDAF